MSLAGPRLQHGWTCLSTDVLCQFLHLLDVLVPAEETYVKDSGQLSLLQA